MGTINTLFNTGPHGGECRVQPPLHELYLPVLTSLQRRAETLWSWYGTVALRGCRLGLLHPRGAPPLLPDIPHSMLRLWKHTRPLFFLSVTATRCLSFCPHSLHPQWWWSRTLVGPLVEHPAWDLFCDDDHDFVSLTFGAETTWVQLCSLKHLDVVVWGTDTTHTSLFVQSDTTARLKLCATVSCCSVWFPGRAIWLAAAEYYWARIGHYADPST